MGHLNLSARAMASEVRASRVISLISVITQDVGKEYTIFQLMNVHLEYLYSIRFREILKQVMGEGTWVG